MRLLPPGTWARTWCPLSDFPRRPDLFLINREVTKYPNLSGTRFSYFLADWPGATGTGMQNPLSTERVGRSTDVGSDRGACLVRGGVEPDVICSTRSGTGFQHSSSSVIDSILMTNSQNTDRIRDPAIPSLKSLRTPHLDSGSRRQPSVRFSLDPDRRESRTTVFEKKSGSRGCAVKQCQNRGGNRDQGSGSEENLQSSP
jgi:hypothetical protein